MGKRWPDLDLTSTKSTGYDISEVLQWLETMLYQASNDYCVYNWKDKEYKHAKIWFFDEEADEDLMCFGNVCDVLKLDTDRFRMNLNWIRDRKNRGRTGRLRVVEFNKLLLACNMA